MIHGLNHESHERLRVASQITKSIVSRRQRTDASTNLPHRFLFVCFVYFVVKNPGVRVPAHPAWESCHPQLTLTETDR